MAVNGADSVAINIEGLASSIKKDMASNDPFMWPDCCIFKTPTILCMHNEKAYVPRAFSIGPFHHGNQNLADTEKIKKKYLDGLISRSPSTKLRDLITSVNQLQTEARDCYSKPIRYNPDEFVKILVIDGCFIIELFRKQANKVPREANDPIFTMSCMHEFLYHDLILLENQVPWKVLQSLYDMTMDSIASQQRESLIKLATNYFKTTSSLFTTPHPLPDTIQDLKHIPDLIIKWMVSLIDQVEKGPNQISSRGEEGSGGEEGSRHKPWASRLVAKIRLTRGESNMNGEEGSRHMPFASRLLAKIRFTRGESNMNEEEGWKQIPSATSLVEAGIKFRRDKSKCILDIKFKDGVLEIPPLATDETTETVFRNLISFEQCYPNCKPRFTSYAVLIDNLINTAKDVDILCENKIIDNWLNPQDAVPFFNKLYHNTVCNEYYYESLSTDVNRYCQRWWPSWRAALVRNYLHTPWAIFSAMAAIILLILSLLQTVYTMK